MNNILGSLLGTENGDIITSIANSFDLRKTEVKEVIAEVVPAITRGIKENTKYETQLDDLLDALASGKHGEYLNDLSRLNQQQTTDDGNAILAHIFDNFSVDSIDVSRQVAQSTSEKTGVDNSVVKKLLPVLATVIMGSLNKEAKRSNLLDTQNGNASSSILGAIIVQYLDADKDGSVIDDLARNVRKFTAR